VNRCTNKYVYTHDFLFVFYCNCNYSLYCFRDTISYFQKNKEARDPKHITSEVN